MAISQRNNSLATRRANSRSGVTSAAVFSDDSTASRSMSAIASASSPGCAASTTEMPTIPSVKNSGRVCASSRQASVVGAGRSASRRKRMREPGTAETGSQSSTSSRAAPSRSSSCFIPYCGCPGSSALQLSSSISRSSAGRTIAPIGDPAIARNNSVVAGMLPVVPAATTGVAGGFSRYWRAMANSRRLRRSARSMAPSAFRMSGQCSRRNRRKSRTSAQWPASASGTSSRSFSRSACCVSASSRNRESGRAMAAARTRPGSAPCCCCAHLRTRAARRRRRRTGSTAGGRSMASVSGSKRNSSSSSSPSARICGRSAAPCRSRAKPLPSTRAERRVGRKIVADASASGSRAASSRAIRPRASVPAKSVPAAIVKRRPAMVQDGRMSARYSSDCTSASGVPTCIHTPSRRIPKSRPCAIARSQSGLIEKSPALQPSKNRG